jgi:hypothetical protein
MSLLNFNGLGPKASGEKKSLTVLFGIGALVGLFVLGSTLAASINLNGGGPIEFGQGVTQTTSCDSEILITPYSEFVNGDPGAFKFSGLTLSQVDTTDQSEASEGCAGKSFLIKLYEEDGSLIQTSFTINVSTIGTFSSTSGVISPSNENSTTSLVNLSFTNPSVNASNVYTITIESSTVVTPTEIVDCDAVGTFAIGEEICGGYVFLTPESPANPTGEYFVVLKGSTWSNFTQGSETLIGPWCDDITDHQIYGDEIGDGEANTNSWFGLVETNTCDSGVLSTLANFRNTTGITWFVPSKSEMLTIYENLINLQMEWNIAGSWYWTSSEYDANGMWMLQNQDDPYSTTTDGKGNYSRIIPILSFSPSNPT